MKYALIGCGRIAVNHIKAVVRNGLELTAVCDLVPEHIDSLFEKTGYEGQPDRYTDYRRMLDEHPELELAAIAT
ncbi:MAG: Gfo/Idh/MocA family oxidoreductase, partial [Oscillospiraceae bacterium]|nr:Gfo/Idh/MocA family oxidoreductase [Oscillospiraceae bacterium]